MCIPFCIRIFRHSRPARLALKITLMAPMFVPTANAMLAALVSCGDSGTEYCAMILVRRMVLRILVPAMPQRTMLMMPTEKMVLATETVRWESQLAKVLVQPWKTRASTSMNWEKVKDRRGKGRRERVVRKVGNLRFWRV